MLSPWILSDEQEVLLELLLENALIHGNQNDPSKPIDIKVIKGDHVAFKITDRGRGFYPELVLNDFLAGRPYSEYFGCGTKFAAKCTQSLVRYSRQGNSVEILFLKGQGMPKPYFIELNRY
jgi:anti-sigma regulatory factor (Ser/Thr protein kinase)